jgi:hypothetical protein
MERLFRFDCIGLNKISQYKLQGSCCCFGPRIVIDEMQIHETIIEYFKSIKDFTAVAKIVESLPQPYKK